MKIVIAPDSFKESLSASEVAKAIKRGLQKALPESECLLLPVGDGGEGTVNAIKNTLGLIENTALVTGPMEMRCKCLMFIKKILLYLKLRI